MSTPFRMPRQVCCSTATRDTIISCPGDQGGASLFLLTTMDTNQENSMKVFLTGATGYIGGTVARRLVEQGHHVRGLTRSAHTLPELAKLGVDPVLGSLDDNRILAEEAREADAVINAADSDHVESMNTFVEALVGTNKPLLHTSGSSIVGETSNGELQEQTYTEEDVWPGSTWVPDPEKASRVAIDRLALAASTQGIRSVVLCNTLIYGTGTGIHKDSVQVPLLVNTARSTGTARHVGPGKNIWSHVHVEDVADLYVRALEGAAPGSFYFAENGESSFKEITSAIATSLGLGLPEAYDIESAIAEWGYPRAVFALGSNSRVRGTARADLGWAPAHDSVTEWIAENIRP